MNNKFVIVGPRVIQSDDETVIAGSPEDMYPSYEKIAEGNNLEELKNYAVDLLNININNTNYYKDMYYLILETTENKYIYKIIPRTVAIVESM